jgi:membrane protease subunit (stomatin/prohibitin family)
VQKAIDDRSRMGVFDDMNKLMQMKSAMAMEKASEAEGDGGMGMGTSLGLMMPAMFAQYFNASGRPPQSGGTAPEAEQATCRECQCNIPVSAKFCPMCGHQQLVFIECGHCGKNLAPNAKFCSRCGHPAEEKPKPVFCAKCGAENLAGSKFCTQCGEKY